MEFDIKKILIFAAGVLVVIIAILYVVGVLKKPAQQTANTQGKSSESIPSLPANQIASSPDLNAVKQDTHKFSAAAQNSGSEISENTPKDQGGKTIGLADFSKANELKIQSGVLNNSSQKDYAVFSCAEKSGQPAAGISLQLRRDVDPKKYQQSYTNMKNSLKDWEKSIFQDLSPFFFPGESFNGTPNFSETKYTTSNKANTLPVRFANLTAVSGKQYSIDWSFLNDQIFISDDKDCLRRELDKNADAFEP